MNEHSVKNEKLMVSISEYDMNKAVTIIAIKGFIDVTSAREFEQKFQQVLNDGKFKLLMDLRDVKYISSSGWGLFLSEIKRIRKEKGDVVLVGMCPEVAEVFELLEFNTIFKAYPDVETAVRKNFWN